MDNQIERHVRECMQCHNADKSQSLLQPPLGKIDNPMNPWEEVSIDILGPVLDTQGIQKYVAVLVDRYSKWPEIDVQEEVSTDAVLKFLTAIFLREGIPRSILSDNGPQFTLEKWRAYMERNGIKVKHTSVYHPAGNGLAERFNRVIMGSVQAVICAGRNWETELRNTLWAYRITPTNTGYSPFKILRGREPFTKDNVAWKQRTIVSKWSPAVVHHNLEKAQRVYIEHFNKRRNVKDTSLERGEWVRVKLAQLKKKGDSKFSAPMQVKEVYTRSALLSDRKVWSQDRMSKCNKILQWTKTAEPQTEQAKDGNQEDIHANKDRDTPGGDPGESEPVVREDQDTQDHWEDSSTQTPKGRPASVGRALPRTPREDQGSNFSTPVRRTCAGRVVVRPSMYRD